MNKIEEIVKNAGLEIRDGKIDLGTANGWLGSMWEVHSLLKGFAVDGSQESRNIGRCYNEYSFTSVCVSNGVTKSYQVIHKVDSGD